MASLILLKSPVGLALQKSIPLTADLMVFGRDEKECQIVLPHHAISRKHARITRAGNQFFIEDLKSRNKTFVNSQEVSPPTRLALKADDRIKICDFLFRFHDERSVAALPLPEWLEKESSEADDDTGEWVIIATAAGDGRWAGGAEPRAEPERTEAEPATPVVLVAGAQPVADFLAPEQINERAGAPSEATDLHAVGIILFQMLTGELPFPPGRPGGKLETIVRRAFVSCTDLCRQKGILSALAPIVDACLRGEYRQTRFLLADLNGLLGPSGPVPIPSPPLVPTPDEPFIVTGFLFEDQLTETFTALGASSGAIVNLRLLKFAYDTPEVRVVYRNATAVPADAPPGVLRRYRVGRGAPVPVAVRTRFQVDAAAPQGGCLAVVEEYVGRRTLTAAIIEGRFRGDTAAIVRVVVPLLEALGYAHVRGAIHARLTPYCVFLPDAGGVKLEGLGGFGTADARTSFGIHATVEAVRLKRGGESTGMTGVGGNRLVVGNRPADPPPDADTRSGRFKVPGAPPDPAPTASQQAERLEALLNISVDLGRTLELDPLLGQIADTLLGVFKQADRCFVIQLDAAGRPVTRATKSRRPGAEGDPRFSRTLVKRTIETVQSYLSEDASSDATLGPAMSIAEFRIRSAMCAPLKRSDGQVLGAIQVDTLDRVKRFVHDDLKLLNAVATLAGVAVEKARLYEAVLEREKERKEIELASKVQLGFLPQTLPDVAGYEFYSHYSPAQTVGGDYYDFIALPGGRIAVVIGDVAGKGMPAALLVAKLSSDVRFCLLTCLNLARAVCLLNDQLIHGGLGDRFIMLVVAVLDPSTHVVTLVNAGHTGPKLYRAATGELEDAISLDNSGVPLGTLPGFSFEQVTISLDLGDTVALFTDGVTDARNAANDFFGQQAVDRVLSEDSALAVGQPRPRTIGGRLVVAVRQHANGHPQSDDIAVVCFGRTDAETAASGRSTHQRVPVD